MRIFRKNNKKDSGKRVSYVQNNNPTDPNIIITDSKLVDPKDLEKRQNDFKFLDPQPLNESSAKFGNNRRVRVDYKPNKLLYINGNTKDALDDSNREGLILHRSTKKEPIKKVYRDFLKDSEKALKSSGLKGEKGIDKELREAIKKEIRKQHKIYKIKRVAKVAVPSTLAIAGGIYMYNKNKNK